MPALPGFSDNPFQSRADLVRAAAALLKPLQQYRSQGKARIKIATATGAGFSETAAQLEGFARPLWVVPSLLLETATPAEPDLDLTAWLDGLCTGTDPASAEYWGDVGDFDQRMVEMEAISFALLTVPERFVPSDPAARARLAGWLRQINVRSMPENNWRWFRVFVNLALVKALQVPMEEVRELIAQDLELLDSFYLGDGWSSDGLWGNERKQADYYSGSFALQFAQLLYVRLSDGHDNERAERYKAQAADFAVGFWRYFDANGAAIPFGRSLTYRYAFAAFWAAVAFAEVPLPAPLDRPGVVKGMLLRHLRWWAGQPDIFNTDGTHNIGYAYPNMYMSENYNSPQSVYWCLKSFVALHLPENHPFWTDPELSHPLSNPAPGVALPSVLSIWPPRHILCNTPEHHFLLSTGQSTRKDHKAREAKYGKFAYSSAFGFSVPSGHVLEQLAPDSTLSLSRDAGRSWAVAWEPDEVRLATFRVGEELVPSLISKWRPWRDVEIDIETTLVAPGKKWAGWHFRIHKLICSPAALAQRNFGSLQCIDAGFAISAQHEGTSLFETACAGTESLGKADASGAGWWTGDEESLVISEAGASGVTNLAMEVHVPQQAVFPGFGHKTRAAILRPDANTNIIASRTLLPCVRHEFTFDSETDANPESPGLQNRLGITFASGVFGISASMEFGKDRQTACWLKRPSRLSLIDTGVLGTKDISYQLE